MEEGVGGQALLESYPPARPPGWPCPPGSCLTPPSPPLLQKAFPLAGP